MSTISIIVPVYNVKEYLIRCLDSIKNQTFNDFEVIVLNDGSTDGSDKLAKEYCAKDKRFTYYSHENRGLGPTRNRGLELASGEYIMYLDSDDWLSSNAMKILFEKAQESDSDIVCGKTVMVHSDGQEENLHNNEMLSTVDINDETRFSFFKDYFYTNIFTNQATDKLYKHRLISKIKAKFGDNKLIYGEDLYYNLQILEEDIRISFIAEPIYYYFQREDSISNTYRPNIIERHFRMVKYYEENIVKETTELTRINSAIFTFEAITLEALNITCSDMTQKDFYSKLKTLCNSEWFVFQMKQINRLKAYNMESKVLKRIYMSLISWLLEHKQVYIASLIVYKIYDIKNKEVV